jgi:DNA-binding IclR family transcriptional regulator
LLAHLEEAGYVERYEKKYRPGWLLFELGTGIDAMLPLGMRRFALPHMADLFAQTHQTVHLGALDGAEIVHVGRMRGAESAVSPIRFGGRGPATCSAMGKIILAHRPPDYLRRVLSGPLPQMTKYSIRAPGVLLQQLREARERGYAVEREETAIGLVAIAVPIQLRNVTIGALALVGRTESFNEQSSLVPLRRSAERVQKSMLMPEARSGRM